MAAENKNATSEQLLANLNIDRVILILPQGKTRPREMIDMKDIASIAGLPEVDSQSSTEKKLRAWTDLLVTWLVDHGFKDTTAGRDARSYTALYGPDGKISAVNVSAMIRQRCGPGNYPQPVEPSVPFEDAGDFDAIIDASVTNVWQKMAQRGAGGVFEHRPDVPDDKRECFRVLNEMQPLTTAVEKFIHAADGTGLGRVDIPHVKQWIKGSNAEPPLREKLRAVADVARAKQVISHEPHHEITPGMILIDEIFKALVTETTRKVNEIDRVALANDAQKACQPLVDYVEDLRTASGEAAKYGAYILPPGDVACDLDPHKKPKINVDPSRIELFLRGNEVRAVSVIVGAWKGGTHSAGHTT